MKKEALKSRGFGKTIKTVKDFSREVCSPKRVEKGNSWAWSEYDEPESRGQDSHEVGEHTEKVNKNSVMS